MTNHILRFFTYTFVGALAAIAGGAANIAFWFALSNLETDPTAGGAYAAVAMLTTLPAMVAGTFLATILIGKSNGDIK